MDEALPESLAVSLRQSGYEAEHVRAAGLAGSPDEVVFRRAQEIGAVLVSSDLEFGDVRRNPPGTHAGILVVRMARVPAPIMVREVVRLVNEVGSELEGSLAIAEHGHIRIRKGT